MRERAVVAPLLVLPIAWLGLATLWFRPGQAVVHARLRTLRDAAELSSQVPAAAVLERAEAVVEAQGLAPLPVVDLPRLWVVVLLLAGAACFLRATLAARGRARLVLGATGTLLILGSVHVWTNLLDVWDQILAGGATGLPLDGGDPRGGGGLADTKPAAGVVLCLGLAGVVDRWCSSRSAAICIAGVAAVVAQMWAFSVSGELRAPVARLPLVAAPLAVFETVFDGLWPELAGAGPLLWEDVLLQGAMVELLLFTNVAAALFLLAGLLLRPRR